MLTIIFYGRDGKAAKARAKEIAADKPNVARVYDVMAWGGQADACDAVEIMPCVPDWKRGAIMAAFPGKVSDNKTVETCRAYDNPDRHVGQFHPGGDYTVPEKPFVTALGDLPKRPRGRPPKIKPEAV